MLFSELVASLAEKEVVYAGDAEVTGVFADSRQVEAGGVFVAVPGLRVDGHAFLGEAVARGAVALVVQSGHYPEREEDRPPCPTVALPDTRQALGLLAATIYGFPSQQLQVVGVTGTNGKTTTCFLINAMLEQAGRQTGLIGSVHNKIGDRWWFNEERFTTPEAPELQKLLAQMVAEQVQVAIIETTSHALALHRVEGCEYDVAVFTNLTWEHLDFHLTKERYRQDKGELFRRLGADAQKTGPKAAILNADDEAFPYFRSLCQVPVVSYGLANPATLLARKVELSAEGSQFVVALPGQEVCVRTPLLGRFNVANVLAALGAGLSLGVGLPTLIATVEGFTGVPGRMEAVERGQPFRLFVDYAHTPDSLQKVLETAREVASGRVLLLFGCSGERDASKRPEMGAMAGRLADFCIITDEDPHHEDPEAILDQLEEGLIASGKTKGREYLRIRDRSEAIGAVLSQAKAGDVVLLTGKGHERSMWIGDEQMPWSDRTTAEQALHHLGW